MENDGLESESVVVNPSFAGSSAASSANGEAEAERDCDSLAVTACLICSSIVATFRAPVPF